MQTAEHDLLVMRAQDGSVAALDRLVRHHQPALLRFAFSLCGDRALAEDAVQEAWMRVARRLRRLDDPRAFRGWLYYAVRWRVIDLQRRTRRETAPDEALASDGGSEHADRERDLDVARALVRLPAPEREVVQLFHGSGLRIGEIASVLGIAPGTVKSRLHRARNTLRNALQGDGQ